MNATPGPMVSGRYFLPKAALLWTKWMPACWVMSRKLIAGAVCGVCAAANALQEQLNKVRHTMSFIRMVAPEKSRSLAQKNRAQDDKLRPLLMPGRPIISLPGPDR